MKLDNIKTRLRSIATNLTTLADELSSKEGQPLSEFEQRLIRLAYMTDVQEITSFIAYSFMSGQFSRIDLPLKDLQNIVKDLSNL